ncbi:MAG TPA: sigma-70 family RNA polymerase sigma factor [Leptospiraceae bacterium]|nr:sigma-70 family RNA polymerase sigma factor [Leptospiraceae bacterium]HMX34488.1 sigma-70 family RNA polymerase sigma factor [Leptospiraceae bacterium]HMY33754.1 sigma-70 family RNA polymerase sigma factor [Leptospiraceae bacterium]HMZ66880.1 sigma-70 family RNA polymerase sigma factor [Leptospiraceae bacterium]HNA07813.1 sigma-70 family RNA polymerase sigma factor [Leptospiraceae bacterium]
MIEQDLLNQLMQEAQFGNSKSYYTLLNKIKTILEKYLSRRIYSHEDREDVLQDILIAIHYSKHTYLPNRPFYPWMYAIAKNVLSKYYKKIQKLKDISFDMDILETQSTDPILEESDSAELMKNIHSAIEELPTRQRQILYMMKFDKMSIKEIALKLKLSEGNVKVIAHRSYQRIRKRLKNED